MRSILARPGGFALLVGTLGALLGAAAGWAYLDAQRTLRRAEARALGYAQAQRLSQRLQEALGPAYMLASLVQQSDGKINNFEATAVDLLAQFPLARAVELAPRGVISQVYPLPGNESVLGHDILKDRNRNREAHLAISRKQLTLAGPFELRQGGLGAVGRYPIFRRHADGRSDFWGFSIVLVRVPELLSAAGFAQLRSAGMSYGLCRHPLGDESEPCVRFAGEGRVNLEEPERVEVDVPNGKWILSLEPDPGWLHPSDWFFAASGSLILGGLLAGLQAFFLRRLRATQGLG